MLVNVTDGLNYSIYDTNTFPKELKYSLASLNPILLFLLVIGSKYVIELASYPMINTAVSSPV